MLLTLYTFEQQKTVATNILGLGTAWGDTAILDKPAGTSVSVTTTLTLPPALRTLLVTVDVEVHAMTLGLANAEQGFAQIDIRRKPDDVSPEWFEFGYYTPSAYLKVDDLDVSTCPPA